MAFSPQHTVWRVGLGDTDKGAVEHIYTWVQYQTACQHAGYDDEDELLYCDEDEYHSSSEQDDDCDSNDPDYAPSPIPESPPPAKRGKS